ncbi:hypothetical protein Taro_009938 [Colocasia esculenta]|uniref:Uncharacterized protein n=1 Tax=Colocasia esculenta TaxID=4460 RepID=A0A843UBG3_COLES|nr:hypothetical protein [Colocasia esculenta]
MVRGGRSGRVSTSVGRESTRIGSASSSTPVVLTIGSASPSMPVVPVTWSASPSTPVVLVTGTASPSTPGVRATEVESHHPVADEEGPQLPRRHPC